MKKTLEIKKENMESLISLKNTVNGMDVEFDVQPVVDITNVQDEREKRIIAGMAEIDEQLSVLQEKIRKLNENIDRLTCHADGLDYATAVISGVITGMIDIFVVGEWNFAEAKKETYKEVNQKVINFAKKQPNYIPYCNTTLENLKKSPPKAVNPRHTPKDPDRLETAIEFLEYQFHLPGDGSYREGQFGIGANTHRIDDLCHHPTIVGLICCVIVQFTGHTLYVNRLGEDVKIPVTINEYGNFVGNNPVTKLFTGVINWFITCAKTIANRKGHLMSDIATSDGLPGSFLSIITELAEIPCFRNEDFLKKLREAYQHGIGIDKGIDLGIFNKLFEGAQSKLDRTTEMAIGHELKRQVIPVVINEILVRGVYFVRRFIWELKEKNNVFDIEWKKVIPFNNRTIARMMTISTSTFTAIDMADAAAHAATKSVDAATFFSNMILRVNFVGVGRCAIAIGVDVGMGVAKEHKRNVKIKLISEELKLLDAKIYYKQAGMWIAADNTGESIQEAYGIMERAGEEVSEALADIRTSLDNIGAYIPKMEEKNPGLSKELLDLLE